MSCARGARGRRPYHNPSIKQGSAELAATGAPGRGPPPRAPRARALPAARPNTAAPPGCAHAGLGAPGPAHRTVRAFQHGRPRKAAGAPRRAAPRARWAGAPHGARVQHGLGRGERLGDDHHQRRLLAQTVERTRHIHRVHVGQEAQLAALGLCAAARALGARRARRTPGAARGRAGPASDRAGPASKAGCPGRRKGRARASP